jgi:hypothetical protein
MQEAQEGQEEAPGRERGEEEVQEEEAEVTR